MVVTFDNCTVCQKGSESSSSSWGGLMVLLRCLRILDDVTEVMVEILLGIRRWVRRIATPGAVRRAAQKQCVY